MLPLLVTAAFAGQSRPISDFDGAYDLSCATASLVLHVGVAGRVGGRSGDWADDVVVDLDCDGVDVEALASELFDGCVASGLPAGACGDVADDVAGAVATLNDDAVGLLPDTLTLRASGGTWLNRWLGVYPLSATATFPSGARTTGAWLVDNNDGANRGHFWGFGLRVPTSGANDYGACADLATAAVDGRIRASERRLEADLAVDRTLVCAGGVGADWLVGQVGLTYRARVAGVR